MNDHTTVAGQDSAATPPPPPLPPPPSDRDRVSGPGADLGHILAKAHTLRGLDWMGPARVAGAILGVAAVLAVLIGLGLRPGIPGLHWTLHTTILFFGMLWAGAFGADVSAHASAGSVHAHAGIAAMPLTITILAFAVGVWLFGRYTRHLSTAGEVFGFALRTALITAIPPLVVSWFLNADLKALAHLFGQGDGLEGFNAAGLTVGFSSWGALLGAFFLTLLVLSGAALLRRDLVEQSTSAAVRRVAPVQAYLAGPVIGFAALVVALIPAGLIGATSVWAFHFGSSSESGSLTWHEWMNLVAGAIAYAPTIALNLLALGSAGQVVASASTSVMNVSYSQGRGLAYLASNDTGLNHGLWIAVLVAPALLLTAAYVVLRSARGRSLRDSRIRLVTWLVSLLVVTPVLFHLASLRAHGSVTGLGGLADELGSGGSDLGSMMIEGIIGSAAGALGDSVSGHASVGPSVGSVFLVFLYAAIITVVLGWLTGLLTRDSLSAMRSRLSYQPAGETRGTAEEQHYEPGDVVNGHRFDGTSWVPVPADPDAS